MTKLYSGTAADRLRAALATIPADATEADRIETALQHQGDLFRLLLQQHPSSTAVSIFCGALRLAGRITP